MPSTLEQEASERAARVAAHAARIAKETAEADPASAPEWLGRPVTVPRKVMASVPPTPRTDRPWLTRNIGPVVAAVSAASGVPEREILGKRRHKRIVRARQVSAYLLREHGGLSLDEVGYTLGYRDHTTVIHSIRQVAGRLAIDADLRGVVEGIARVITAPAQQRSA